MCEPINPYRRKLIYRYSEREYILQACVAIQSLALPFVDGLRCFMSMDQACRRMCSPIVRPLNKRPIADMDATHSKFCRSGIAQIEGCNVRQMTDSHPCTISGSRWIHGISCFCERLGGTSQSFGPAPGMDKRLVSVNYHRNNVFRYT